VVNIRCSECCTSHVAHEPRRLLGKGEEEEREQKDDIAHLDDLVYSIFYVTSQGGYDRVAIPSASTTSLGLGRVHRSRR
jgi:hypothetical protein